MSKTKKSEDYTWGEILDSFKRGVLGSDEDFDNDFEEVEVEESEKSAEQADRKTKEPAKSAQETESASKPAQKTAEQKTNGAGSVFCSSLQTDLNTFVQTGTASGPLLQLLKEGFDKNPDLLEEVAKYITIRRRGEERIHPGYLVSYKGERSMFLTKEKALDHLLSTPGASVRETIFTSIVKNGKTVDTREATEEEKKRYYERKSSEADASGQEGQDY